ncbi:hypothetical protein AAF712_012183 [Marasmius tenuissimus]|uniref:Uncharacterized protein n=1 Tax=Marasmius tenuissimus TaxID=585030 RepID=A0ABR2ZIG1_9AGAR
MSTSGSITHGNDITYFCDCPVQCKRYKKVSRRTFFGHVEYRTADSQAKAIRNGESITVTKRPRQKRKANNITAAADLGSGGNAGAQSASNPERGRPPSPDPMEHGDLHSPEPRSPPRASVHSPPPSPSNSPPPRMSPRSSSPHHPPPTHDPNDLLDVLNIPLSRIEDIETTQKFIAQLREATLDDCGLSAEDVERPKNPRTTPVTFDTNGEKLSVKLYLSHRDTSIEKYNETCEAIEDAHPPQTDDDKLLSHYRVQKLVRDLTGINGIDSEMCPNSCLAYAGEYKDLQECSECGLPRVDAVTKKPQLFSTIPFPFVVQGLHSHRNTAKDMQYFREHMEKLTEEYLANGGMINELKGPIDGPRRLQRHRIEPTFQGNVPSPSTSPSRKYGQLQPCASSPIRHAPPYTRRIPQVKFSTLRSSSERASSTFGT